MRLFQVCGVYRTYAPRFERLTAPAATFVAKRQAFLSDRFGAPHFLRPVLDGDDSAFFTVGDRESLQRLWAKGQGIPASATLEEILLSQIEHHKAEVFYNLDPMAYGADLPRRLPACVRLSVAWRAAPSHNLNLGLYSLVLCNFPTILQTYREQGWRAEYFTPAHDPVMDEYASQKDRPIDVLFVGGYSRFHERRAEVLRSVASLAGSYDVRYCLDASRLTRLAETPLGLLPPLRRHRRPSGITRVSGPPAFGRDLYSLLSQSKIVLNGAVDMAGNDRGNMRCFEALGCGALMFSDAGAYPAGWEDGQTMRLYTAAEDAKSGIVSELLRPEGRSAIARQGYQMVSQLYSKQKQWANFRLLVGQL